MSRPSGASELYKDKIEVSLDGRQIFYLFFGGAVIVGLVFVLGVMVGRRVEARGHVERAQTQAAVDPLAALDRLEGGAGLSFQGSLRGADAPASDVEKTIGELAKQREAQKTKKGDKKPEAKAEPKPEAKAEPKPEPKIDAKPEPKIDAKPEVNAAAVKPEVHAEAKKPDDKKVEDKKPEAKKPDDKKVVASADDKPKKSDDHKDGEKKSKFTLQLSSFQDKGEAEAYLAQVKANGFGAYLTEGDVDGKTFYRVRMGNYRSLDAANDAKVELEKATKKSATVMKL